MRRGFFVPLLLIAFLSNAQNSNVLHYRFSIDLNDKNDTIYGAAEIKLVTSEPGPIIFDLEQVAASGKGMLVTGVEMGAPLKAGYAFTQKENKVVIPNIKATGGDTTMVRISYKGIPKDGLIISKNKFGERTFFGDNWPNRAHNWIPCVDRPDDKASFEFIVSAPAHYSVISNGLKVTETVMPDGKKQTHWKEDIALPTKVMVIGVARFAVKAFEDSPKDIPVSAWVYPKDSAKGVYDFALAPSILNFFSGYIAPFPYKKLANVQSTTIFGGMENASAIFYAENLVTGNRSAEDVVAHEIAHQWFGDAASEKSFAHLWLSEGFATYMTNLYWEKTYGKAAATERLKKERQEVIDFATRSSSPVVDSASNLMSLLNANSYQKGGWVLHMLRAEVGDTIFQKIIQTYYNQYKGGNADTRDFEAIAETVSGRELTGFFNQWLYQPGVPKLMVTKKKEGKTLKLKIAQVGRVYRLPLTIRINTKDGRGVVQKLLLTTKETEITWKGKAGAVTDIMLDPDVALLYEEVKK